VIEQRFPCAGHGITMDAEESAKLQSLLSENRPPGEGDRSA
jgi:hypothetical protein